MTFAAHRAKSVTVRSSCINPGSALHSCICLSALTWCTCRIAVACLARRTINFDHKSSCQLTGFGQETRTIPPSGGISRVQVHRDRSLHLGNARIPPGSPAIKGSEDGGGRRAASGRELSTTSSAPHAPPGRKALEQNAVVSCVPLRETNHPAAWARDLAVY